MSGQQLINYKIIGIGPDDRALSVEHDGASHVTAYRFGVAYWSECQAGTHPGVAEVRMTATNRWGETSISGRWPV